MCKWAEQESDVSLSPFFSNEWIKNKGKNYLSPTPLSCFWHGKEKLHVKGKKIVQQRGESDGIWVVEIWGKIFFFLDSKLFSKCPVANMDCFHDEEGNASQQHPHSSYLTLSCSSLHIFSLMSMAKNYSFISSLVQLPLSIHYFPISLPACPCDHFSRPCLPQRPKFPIPETAHRAGGKGAVNPLFS